jgi:hypothetical protein
MIRFRSHTPTRRENPTKSPTGNSWADHKEDLKEDFKNKCGYCDSYDGYRHTYYEVDHFIPKDFLKKNYKLFSLTDYKNLVYSCKFCNNSKRAKWPSKSRKTFNDGLKGFVDPCDKNYNTHFYRTADGGIMWRTPLGKWMFTTAFKFDERQQAIKILWNLYRLEEVINALTIQLTKHREKTKVYKNMKSKIGDFCFQYYKYHQELIRYYDNL